MKTKPTRTPKSEPTITATDLCNLTGLSPAECKQRGIAELMIAAEGFSYRSDTLPPTPTGEKGPMLLTAEEFCHVLSNREEITTAGLAEISGYSPRRINQLVTEGHLPEPIRHGVFNQNRAINLLMVYVRVKAANS